MIWKTVQEILDLESFKSNVILQIKNKSCECISDPNEISNELNSYFSNVGLNLAKNMPDITTYKPPNIKPSIKLFFPNISANYITLCFSNMNDNKSVPCDSVPIKYSKMSNFIIVPILSYLINLCVNQGCFFNYSKVAQVIPIFKFGKN